MLMCRWLPAVSALVFLAAHGAALSDADRDKPKTPDPQLQKLLDPILESWEKSSKNLESMHVVFKCEKYDPNFKVTTRLDGHAKFLNDRGDYRAFFELRDPGNKVENYEKILYTGTHVYIFRGAIGVVEAYPIDPKQKNKGLDDGPLALLFGMSAKAAKERYQIVVDRLSTDKDRWYTYIHVWPNFAKDKSDFLWAEVAIYNHERKDASGKTLVPRHMPARVVFVEPSKNQVTWEIQLLERNGKSVLPEDFVAPAQRDLPKGWKLEIHKTPPGESPKK